MEEHILISKAPNFMSSIVESCGSMIFAVDAERRVAYANPASSRLSGLSEEQLTGSPLDQLFDFTQEQLASIERTATTGTSTTFDAILLQANNYSLSVQLTVSPLKNDTISNGLVIAAVDITERKQVETFLHESNLRFLLATNIANIGIFDHNHITDSVYLSPEHRRMFGRNPYEEVNLEMILKQWNSADKERIGAAIRRAHDPAGDGLFDVEYRITDASGATRWMQNRARTVFDGKGASRHAVRTVGVIWDITEKKQAELALRQKEEQYRTLVENSPDFILILSKDYQIQYVNRVNAWKSIDKIMGANFLALVLPEYMDTVKNTFQNVMNTGKPGQCELQVYDTLGAATWLDTRVAPIFEGNAVTSFMLVSTDATERKRIAKILRSSESRYRTIVETAQEGVWLIDNQAITTYVNPKMAEILGYKPAEMLDLNLLDFMDESMREKAQANLKRRAQGIKEHHEFCFKHKNGKDVWTSISTNPIMDEQGQYVAALAMVTDITERKQAAAEMREQQQFLQFVLDNIPARVFWKDANGKFLGCNRLFAQDWGLTSPAEVIGKDDYDLNGNKYADQYREDDGLVMESGVARLNFEEPQVTEEGHISW